MSSLNRISIALSVLLLSLLTSCSSSSTITAQQPLNKIFRTLITDDGSKRFELTLNRKQRRPSLILEPSRSSQSVPKGYSEKKLISLLNGAIELSGFCRQGYLLLGRYAGKKTNHRLRGECREKASEEDKLNFPNTITSW